jgi:hypothetical protein
VLSLPPEVYGLHSGSYHLLIGPDGTPGDPCQFEKFNIASSKLGKKGKGHCRTHTAPQRLPFWFFGHSAAWDKVELSSAILLDKLKEGIHTLDRIIGRIF